MTPGLHEALALGKAAILDARDVIASPKTVWWRRVALVACVAYLVSPIDLIPDFIPVLGWADDALVVLLALWLIKGARK
jgi:uncharacterized membrane protein YkvA (DUF1232 family)